MVKPSIRQLMTLDAGFARHAQWAKGVFGDGYLLKNNKYYRNIRSSLHENGYRLTDKDSQFYTIQPLLSLEGILKSKKIPYIKNSEGMRFALENRPKLSGDFLPYFSRNYITHESAHCLANSILSNGLLEVAQHQDIRGLFLQEAYAGVCEVFCGLEAKSQIHQIFVLQNTYDMLSPQEMIQLEKARKMIGSKKLFNLLMCAYYYSNSLYLKVSDRDLKIIFDEICLLQLNKKDFSFLKKVFHTSLNLYPGFTYVTASMYLKFLGVKKSLSDLTRRDPLAFLRSPACQNYFAILFDFLNGGVR